MRHNKKMQSQAQSASRLLRGGRLTKWKGKVASFAPRLTRLMPASALVVMTGLITSPVAAETLYWNPNGFTAGRGGSGTWDTTTVTAWDLDQGGVCLGPCQAWPTSGFNDAIFGDAGNGNAGFTGTVTLGAPITVQSLTFQNDTAATGGLVNTVYTITGGTLTLNGTATITVEGGSGDATTINSVIAGNAGLTKAGGGTLTLSGANTFSGGVTVNAGALILSGTNTFSGGITVNAGTLTVTNDAAVGAAGSGISMAAGTTLSIGAVLNAGRVVTLGAGGQVTAIGGGAASTRYTGSGGIIASALTNNNNNYTGQTTLQSGGSVSFSSIGDLGQQSALGAPTDATLGTVLIRTGVTPGGDQFSDSASYTGGTASTNRNFDLRPGPINGAALTFRNQGSGTLTINGNIALTAGGSNSGSNGVSFSADSADLQLLGVISSTTARNVGFSGTGSATRTITLGDANTFAGTAVIGNVTVKAGTLANSGSNSSLGSGSLISIGNNGVLSYIGGAVSIDRAWSVGGTGTIRNDSATGAMSLSGATSLGAGSTLALGGSYTASDNTFAGDISGTGNLASVGPATWVLTGNNTRTGAITVSGGTLRAGTATAFGTTTGITVNGGTLDLNGFNLTAGTLAGTGGTLALGSANLTINAASGTTDFAGTITGTGGLTKLGASTLTLTGDNGYTGDTTIGGGTLALNFADAGAPATDIIEGGSHLNMTGGTLTATGADGETNVQNFAGLTVTAGINKINATAGASGGTMTVNLGAVNRSGGLIDFGIGTGVTMTVTPDTELGGWATVNGSDYAKVQGGQIVAFEASDYTTKDDAATWTVNGEVITDDDEGNTNSFSGEVGSSVQLGGLRYTETQNSTVSIASGQTLGVDGTIIVASTVENSIKTINGPGFLTGSAGAGGVLGVLQNGGVNSNFIINATIINNGAGPTGFSKAGAGKVTLSGLNTYTGGTTISQGTLSINSIANGGSASAIGASDASSSNLVIEGATLSYTGTTGSTNRGFTLAKSGAITSGTIEVTDSGANLTFGGEVVSNDGAGLIKKGPGTLTLSNANNSYTGVTSIEGGTLAVTTLTNGGSNSSIGAASAASANLLMSGGGSLQYNGITRSTNRGFTLGSGGGGIGVQSGTTLTVSGIATGAGSFTKSGTGTLVLSGANNYTGSNLVNAGILRAGHNQAFGGAANGSGAGAMTVASGATLDVSTFSVFVGGLNGFGNVTIASPGVLKINANGNFSGVVSGTGSLEVHGQTQVMNGCNNTYTGRTRLSFATLSTDCLADGGEASGIGSSTSDATNLELISGTIEYTGGSVDIDRSILLTGDGGFKITTASTTLGISGNLSGGGGIVKQGPGTLVLSGTNTHTGRTDVQGGILRAAADNAFGTGGMVLRDTAGVTLDLDGFDTTVAYLSVGGSTGGNVTLDGATLTISHGQAATYAGAISGAGNLVKNGPGQQTFSGCNSSYSGTTAIEGVLQVDCLANGLANSSIGASSNLASNLVLNGGTLRYVGTGHSTDRLFTLGTTGGTLDASGTGAIEFTNTGAIALTGTTARTLTLTGTSDLSIENRLALQITDADPTTGRTSLTKTGTNLWILGNATSTYTGVTRISAGVLGVDKLANGGSASSIGMSGSEASNLIIGNSATLRYTGTGDSTNRLFTLAAGVSSIESSGSGAIAFTSTGDVGFDTGTNNQARTLALGGSNTGVNIMGVRLTNAGTGVTSLVKNGPGTWILTGNNTFTGNTTINEGNLIVGDLSVNGGTTGNVGGGNVIVNSTTSVLSFNRSNAFDVTGHISGTGSIAQIGTGTTTLTRDNIYTGTTTVSAGILLINGNQTAANGLTSVLGGTLGGTGIIGGAVTVANGATIRPGSNANGGVGQLTINGALTLNETSILNYQFGQAGTPGGAQNDLLVVNGNLTLDGQLNVTQSPGGTFGPGVYRIISYDTNDTFINNGLTASNPDFYVQTSIGGQVNLVNTGGQTLRFWDGQIVAQKNNNVVNGGDGTWQGSTGNDNWTIMSGQFNAPFTTAAIAVFGGAQGTVTVDNDAITGNVIASGMQFLTNGYLIQGEAITLVENSANPGQSVITVGDGSANSANITATISAELTGTTQLVKADLGTLILSGTNSYTGGTAINGGVLQVANNGNLSTGALSFNGGTLRNTDVIDTSRAVTLNAGGGTFETQANLTLGGVIGGPGGLSKTGTETLILTNTNTYGGGTTISAGTLQLGTGAGGSNTGSITGNVVNNGTLAFNRSNDYLFGGTITGSGAVTQIGGGTTTLTANNDYQDGTTISAGTLQLGNNTATGAITGNVLNNAALAFNRSNEYIFAGVISGTGEVIKRGDGVTILTGTNTYDGETTVEAGTLLVNGNQSDADGDTTVLAGAVLGGIGTIGGNVFNSGTLSPGLPGNAPGTLTIEGNLVLNSTSILNVNFGQANFIGGQFNDHIVVGGSLTLDGTLNVTETPGGTFGPGVYRVISYDPATALGGPGLTFNNPNFTVQTSIAGQVNLVNTGGLELNYWDGDAGSDTLNAVNGGDGTWRNANDDNWTDQNGSVNSDYADGAFAIFAGSAGNVTVSHLDGVVEALGMQFATGGYVIGGESINLVGDPTSIIRVGDGTLASAAFTATINSSLTGTTQLVKTDFGTLVLGGANTYTGGTAINGGVLQVANDGNLGHVDGDLSFDGGTLRNTAAFASDRDAVLNAGGGTFETAANLTLNGIVSGAGNLIKTGTGALILEGDNTYSGTTTVAAGALIVNGIQVGPRGDTTVDADATIGGSGTITGNVIVAAGGILAPGGVTDETAIGTLTINGNLTLNDGAILNYSFGNGALGGPDQPGGGPLNDLVNVNGNLTLAGTLNVTETAGGSFGPGIYRVFNYDPNAVFTNNGLALGSMPDGNFTVQTSQIGQVNLVNTTGVTLNYWDGDAGPINNGVVNGGIGTWRAAGDDNWTDMDGSINAAYANGGFAVFMGTAATVEVVNDPATGGQVQAEGMQFLTTGYTITGDAVELVNGPSTIRVGDGNASSASYVATIEASLIGASQLVKDDYGTLVLTGLNGYTGGTSIVQGTLQVSQDANLGNGGDLSFSNDGTLRTTASFETDRNVAFNSGGGTFLTDDATILTVNGVLSGPGNFTKAGTGKMVLTGDSSGYMATTDIDAGTLTVNGSLCGHVNVNAGARLEGTGTVCDTTNFAGGTIAPGDGGIGTLTVDGDYVGGGLLEIETVLGDDTSQTDLLHVTGSTSGTTAVTVANLGGGGAQTINGIKIVDVDGTSAGVFALQGDYVFQGEQAVVAGAYSYVLRQNGVSTPQDGDWYLRSSLTDAPEEPILSPAVPIYEAFASILQEFDELETLQRRIGNRQWLGGEGDGAVESQGFGTGQKADRLGIWARVKAGHAHLEPKNASTVDDYEVTSWKIQAGTDVLLSDSDSGSLIGGLALHFGTASANITSFYGDGDIDVMGYGISGTLTWYGVGGFYVDSQAQASLYDSDLKSSDLGELEEGNNGWGYALSIEAGQKLPIGGHWSLTPQAQLTYAEVEFDDFTDPYDGDVSIEDSDTLVGRLGISADYENEWQDEMGQVNRAHLYGISSVYYDFLDGTEVDVSGSRFFLENEELWGSAGLGGSLAWADDKYALYGEALAKTSLEAFGDSYSLNGTLGFRVKW